MSYEVTEARYRVAAAGDRIPDGRVVAVVDEPGVATVIVRPGHASELLLRDIADQQASMLATGQWLRLEPGTEPGPGQDRVTEACWQIAPAGTLPEGIVCLPVEKRGRHVWLIREGEASEQLIREMSELLTAMVRAGVWVQKWTEALDAQEA
ncbi:hypothetical protein ACRAR1_06890 [Streptomyces sanyensis]|uniref:hypothetical protein n=1 Tax=Streptomyces sanyensis TaxID=568869 RepID=UPI003D77A289